MILLEDKILCTKLTLSNIFVIFNKIKLSVQGPNENILSFINKLVEFQKEKALWKNKAQEGNWKSFS